MKNNTVYNGINFYFNGLKKDKVIVFIHGNSLDATTFKKQFEGLGNIPLVAIDLPGHGLSQRVNDFENTYCVPGYINAVRAVVEHLDLSNIILAGHSLGGHVAIEAADELSNIRGLMIFGTPPIGIPPQMEKMFNPNPAMGQLFSAEVSEEDAHMLSKEFVYNNAALTNRYPAVIRATDGNARANLGASIAKGQFKDELDIVANCKIPVAVLNGEKDAFVNKDYVNGLTIENLWSNKKIWIRDAGHMIQEEKPEEFNSIIKEFYKYVFA